MEFPGAFDQVDRRLAEMGWHIAYCNCRDMFGHGKAIEIFKQFHDALTSRYHLSSKSHLFGFSRGGLYALRYAVTWPADVACVYLDAPVLDLESWPLGKGASPGSSEDTCKMQQVYAQYGDCPPPRSLLDAYCRLSIPTLLVAGMEDRLVPWEENGALLEALLQKYQVPYHLVLKPGCGHHPHSLSQTDELISFLTGKISPLDPDPS